MLLRQTMDGPGAVVPFVGCGAVRRAVSPCMWKDDIMTALKLAAVSRNHFNLPASAGVHAGLFAAEGLAVSLELYEPIDEVTERLSGGRVQLDGSKNLAVRVVF
jgi:hypothetical protein